ncbi:MAG TPA: sugar phosphate isomerase/epimerase family protein [Bryobacteraceae bacterium]|nr:sugar phosphate isomerase/epimerase family protein [Bryobacteraceae bacterium]
MYLSLNPTVVAGRVPWPDLARLAAKVGFPAVDVDLSAAMKAGLSATRALFEELGIKPAAVDLPVEFRKDDGAFHKDLDKLDDASAFSAAIGCPRMITWIMPSSKTPKAELRALYLKRFSACADVLARAHVRLGLEFLGPLHLRQMEPYEFIWRMPEMLAFARECGPNVGLLLDVWHWHHAGATMDDIVRAGKDGIVHVHFSDAPNLPPEKIRDDERLMPGEGVINLVGFLQALREIGYQDAVSVEVFGRGLKDMPPEEGARLALESARGVMRKAGIV